jgi:hypothetical protein
MITNLYQLPLSHLFRICKIGNNLCHPPYMRFCPKRCDGGGIIVTDVRKTRLPLQRLRGDGNGGDTFRLKESSSGECLGRISRLLFGVDVLGIVSSPVCESAG